MRACFLDISGMNFLRRCTAQLGRLHPLLFIYVVWILSYGVLMPLIYLDSLQTHDALHIEGGPTHIRAYGLGSRLLLGSFIVPAIETAVFQWLPVRLLCNGLKLPKSVAIAASAVFFGLAHGYSSGYVVFTSLIGVVLAWAFVARDYEGGRAYLWVGVVHALRNAVSTLLM